MADAFLDLLRQRLIELRSAHLARDDVRLLATAREIGEQLIFESTDLAFLSAEERAELREWREMVQNAEDGAFRDDIAHEEEIDRLTRALAEARKS